MKFFSLIVFTLIALTSFGQPFGGNGKSGFGGVIGTGNVLISDGGGFVTFTFTKGSGDFNDCAVIYIDTKSGGATSTSGFTDQGDGLRKAISGLDGGNRSILNFADGFTPDYAIAFNVGVSPDHGFGGIWNLSNTADFAFINAANLTPDDNRLSKTYTVKTTMADIGIPSGGNLIKFLVTYTSTTAYRSNEFIGDPGPNENIGWTPYTSTTFFAYGIASLPVGLTNFVATKKGDDVNLQWQAEQENNIERYDIMRSGDANNFVKIGAKSATGSYLKQLYNFVDNDPLSGNNFYKIAVIEKDGKIHYSDVALVKTANNTFKAYTTSSNRILKINWNNESRKVFNLMLANQVGQVVFKAKITPASGMNTYSFDLNKTLATGIYSVQITDGNEIESQLILIR